jgi:NAD(P)-dependent dehydrogenase (short-subunit alcohol dehydrogenase family)
MGEQKREEAEGTKVGRREFLAGAAGLAATGVPAPQTASAQAPASTAADGGAATVLITGSNRGIGLEFAKRYAERGWKVIATCRDPASANALKELAGRSPKVTIERLDVVDHPGIDALAAKYAGQPIDVLLNNAGIGGGGENQEFGKLKYDVYAGVLKVNAEGPIKMCEAFLKNVEASKQKKMMTVSSNQGSIGNVKMPMLYWYRSSKSAVNMIMVNLALQLKSRGIIVGLVTPGPTDTDFMAGLPKRMLRPVEEAVRDMMREIDRFDMSMTGQFLGFKGDILPW